MVSVGGGGSDVSTSMIRACDHGTCGILKFLAFRTVNAPPQKSGPVCKDHKEKKNLRRENASPV